MLGIGVVFNIAIVRVHLNYYSTVEQKHYSPLFFPEICLEIERQNPKKTHLFLPFDLSRRQHSDTPLRTGGQYQAVSRPRRQERRPLPRRYSPKPLALCSCRCSFPVRVGSTGNQAPCGEGTKENPVSGTCFWALPEGQRDLRPGEAGHYILPNQISEVGGLV